MRLIANNMGYGPLPAPGEEVEQRLTLTANGKVWLSRFPITTQHTIAS